MVNKLKGLMLLAGILAVSGCGGGGEDNSTVVATNKAPVISGSPSSAIATQAFRFIPLASDPDGDPLTFSISNKPTWLSFKETTGELTGTPTASDLGNFNNIVLSVSDGKLTASITITITVQAAPVFNVAPTIAGTPAPVIEEQPFSFTPTAADPNGDVLSFAISNKPAWLNFDATSGKLSGTPSLGAAAVYPSVGITVSDGKLSAVLNLTIEVKPAQSVTFTPTAGVVSAAYFHKIDTKITAPNVSYRIEQLPTWATFDEKTLTISGTPDLQGAEKVSLMVKNNQQTWLVQGTIDIQDSARYLAKNAIDFYSKNYDGALRTLRNDLDGTLAAEVQFVQSHSVAPNNNFNRNTGDETKSRYMPRLVAQRDTLLLFIPNSDAPLNEVRAELTHQGKPVTTIQLQHPNLLPAADLNNGSSVTYSSKAWWAYLPWQQVKNGLEVEFFAADQRGKLTAANIDMGEASQLVLKSIRLGMLTTPDQSQGHYTLREPVLAATDYFQTIPISKLVVASYADMTLDKVIVASGRIYEKSKDVSSSTSGDVYSGDMRENVAKAQVSTGINLADYGYTSNNMNQSYPHVFKQITNHHAWGQYTNGRVAHGLSGGNGIGTLINSWGNEASHEWGHAYGLGHYPGQELTTDGRWAVHHADSGWGYIAHRKRMRSNIDSLNTDGSMTFHKDAMSGGYANSQFSTYTHHTGYSARVIQANLESFPIADTSFASGYKKWDRQTGQYATYRDANNRPVPIAVGVPVATLLGGYDPVNYPALIYPVFHGNYGNLFDLPKPDLNSNADQCWLEIANAANEVKQVAVAATRHNAAAINQFHINIAAEFKPTLATLHCRHKGITTELTRTTFDGQIPVLPEVAIVGQEHGFKQLKQREFAEIAQELDALPLDTLLMPSGMAVKVDSYELAELFAALSAEQSTKLRKMLGYRAAAIATTVLLSQATAAQLPPEEVAARLKLHLKTTRLLTTDNVTLTGSEIHGSGYFFDGSNGENANVMLTARTGVEEAKRTAWTRDAYGRLHLTAQPWLCATHVGNNITMLQCSLDNLRQRWGFHENNPLVLKNIDSAKCLDFDRTNVKLIPYSCHGGSNQRWNGVVDETQLWLAVLNGAEIRQVMLFLNK